MLHMFVYVCCTLLYIHVQYIIVYTCTIYTTYMYTQTCAAIWALHVKIVQY